MAQNEGNKRKATIVIWGFYGNTGEKAPLSVHFEVLRPPKKPLLLRPILDKVDKASSGLIQTPSVKELTSFTLQTRLSNEISFLTLFTVGLIRYTASDWNKAITNFSDALKQVKDPIKELDQSIVYFYRGTAYVYKKDYDRAIADYKQALKLNPKLAEAYNNQGFIYIQLKDYKSAIADCSQAIKLQPKFALAYANRGAAYSDSGISLGLNDKFKEDKQALDDFNQAIADFNQVIKLQPNNNKEDYDRAIADFNIALKLDPNYFYAYDNRCDAYGKKGDYDKPFGQGRRQKAEGRR